MGKKGVSPLAVILTMRGKTQQEIADLLNVRRETVSNWMTGKTPARLTLEEWSKLANFLDMTLEQLPKSFAPQPINDSQNQNQN
ncbi:helix-turn-helix transcriptional regulator [Pseudanabaena sp. 'Roaring Creek']|uniref:helix-turn-helix domain-containing protein n=1 Tax=Pseudanabaena sp. 'Roaring Creek' TaxID=1681830 RepID=UPI00092F061A|nr:helix-turn-helix transcriptional regulator [Pseudanabaena sp. 'Roaring Creek']